MKKRVVGVIVIILILFVTRASAQNDGIPQGGVTFGSPKVGGASGSFDGVDDYVYVPDSGTLLPTAAYTFELWAMKKGTGSAGERGMMISKAANYIDWNWGGSVLFSLEINNTQRLLSASGAIVLNQWTHFVGTYDGTYARLYKNGVQIASAVWVGTVTDDVNPLRIGSFDGGGYLCNGLIDEVRVYSRALSEAEVLQHYQGNYASNEGLVAYWPMNGDWLDHAGDTEPEVDYESLFYQTLMGLAGAVSAFLVFYGIQEAYTA